MENTTSAAKNVNISSWKNMDGIGKAGAVLQIGMLVLSAAAMVVTQLENNSESATR